ncbi:hypothetical protein ACI75Y_09940 [Capnocytophaga stomatis]|uniref:hypothetical protein n=1 Tax=Capnocytophaga stomatis TaxID=1848904 RepID=UPI00385D092D
MKIKTHPEKNTPKTSKNIQLLIEEAYHIFDYQLNGRLSVCTPCCVSAERMQELLQTPVSELSACAIYDYLDAVHYDESGYEIKHFLPRILELLAEDATIRHSTELTLNKCHFERSCWRQTELDFMKRFSAEFIRYVLTNFNQSQGDDAMNYILMFNLAGLPTEHLLEIWENELSSSPIALKHLEVMMYYYIDSEGYYSNAFSENPSFNNQVRNWVISPKLARIVLPIIEKEYFENQNLTEEARYYLDLLYGKLERNLQ